ncbi:MAG: aldehyde dehydrogenase family protein [bacterium]|nr:aldehyde dehydrogenase family protein [bacterium]
MINFEQGTVERQELINAIIDLRTKGEIPTLPLVVNGEFIFESGAYGECTPPHDITRTLARYAHADTGQIKNAIEGVLRAQTKWQSLPWHLRLHIFRKAAYLLQHKYFYDAVTVVMEDFSKNPYEAMIDVVELIDFWNFNVYFASEIYQEQPESSAGDLNFMDYRPWQGFIAALPPNNFVAISLNIPTTPLMMGNVVVCKPAPETVFSFHFMLNILHEAGLPLDVLAVLHGDEQMIGSILLDSPHLAAVHFTGSMQTMEKLVTTVGKNVHIYNGFPEVIGETGGKDFMIVYDDAPPLEAAAAIAQSAFGYQGRKCSALSRLYLTHEKWSQIQPILAGFMNEMKAGDVADFSNYLGAIISRQEYEKIKAYIERAYVSNATKEIYGGVTPCIANEKGYWINPTIIVSRDPYSETMTDEIFGPVLTVYPMSQEEFNARALHLCNDNPYRLTGAAQTSDIVTLSDAINGLRHAAGNLYDCRTTGAVVNRQPFGGSGKSGSNSKPGSKLNLYRWVNPQSISLMNIKPAHFAPAYLDRD